MKCKNKKIIVEGFVTTSKMSFVPKVYMITITNDDIGKTISIRHGEEQITIPADEIAKWLN